MMRTDERKERKKKTSEERQVQRIEYRKKRLELLKILRAGKGEPTPQERQLILNYLQGMPKKRAAESVGLTKKQAFGRHGIIKRPRVQSFLTDALETAGLTTEAITGVLIDALSATKPIHHQGIIFSEVPDYGARLGAYDRIVDAYGVGGQQKIDPKEAQRQEGLTVHFHLHKEVKQPPDSKDIISPPAAEGAINVKFGLIGDESN